MNHLVLSVDVVIAVYVVMLVIAACITIVCFRKARARREVMDNGQCKAAVDGIVFDTYAASKEEVGGGGCVICLNEYEDGEKRVTIAACNHRFHALCIDAWFKQMHTCPLCRHDLV